MPKKIDKEITQRAFSLYVKGWSLRKLENHFGIPKETIGYRFRKIYGRDYKQINNALPIIREYLKSRDISPKDKKQIRDWLNSLSFSNTLINIGTNTRLIKLYTQSELEILCLKECGHKKRDWRELFEVLNLI